MAGGRAGPGKKWKQGGQLLTNTPIGSVAVNVVTPMLTPYLPKPSARPNVVALLYGAPFGAMPSIPPKLPPVFMAWAQDDAVALEYVRRFYAALLAAGCRPEAHIFKASGHGFGLRMQGTGSDHWIEDFYAWLQALGYAKATATHAKAVELSNRPERRSDWRCPPSPVARTRRVFGLSARPVRARTVRGSAGRLP
jgi:hypothetical protein